MFVMELRKNSFNFTNRNVKPTVFRKRKLSLRNTFNAQLFQI